MTNCETFDTIIVRDMCKTLDQGSHGMWSDFIEHSQPKIKCPFRPPLIKTMNAVVDLGLVSHLPLDGYNWLIAIKLFKSIGNSHHKKTLLFCIMCEATITKTRERGRK